MLVALHFATERLLNSSVVCPEKDEMYAVFAEESAISAFAFLLIGFSRHASIERIDAEEAPRKIFIRFSGRFRVTREALTDRDLLPEEEADRADLERFLEFNRMTYKSEDFRGTPTLTVSIPRYLADDCDVCAVDKEETRMRFYCLMRSLAGVKKPLRF